MGRIWGHRSRHGPRFRLRVQEGRGASSRRHVTQASLRLPKLPRYLPPMNPPPLKTR